MVNYKEIEDKLKSMLKPSRFKHVLGVVEAGVKINEDLKLGLDQDKVKLGCYLHDCAKGNEDLYFKKYASKYGLTSDLLEPRQLLHTKLAPIVAKEEYKVFDQEILDSLRWHTTGKADMTSLEKVVFLADAVERGRDYPNVDYFRKLAKKDLDKACLEFMDHTIKYLIDQGQIIEIETVEARNYLRGAINGKREI